MTAEVAVLNRAAIALAADSAVTVRAGQPKVYNTVNKLFALSKRHPVGVMIYGNASVDGVPWETVIKMYRMELGDTACDTVEEHADHFLAFLAASREIFNEATQLSTVRGIVSVVLNGLVDEIKQRVRDHFKTNPSLDGPQEAGIVREVVQDFHRRYDQADRLENISEENENSLKETYDEVLGTMARSAFEKLPLDDETFSLLTSACALVFSRKQPSLTSSGVVIAGFGRTQIYPALVNLRIRHVVNNRVAVGSRDSTDAATGAAIVPFAQDDMVRTFVEGVNPNFRALITTYLQQVFADFPTAVLKNQREWQELPAVDQRIIGDHLRQAGEQLLELMTRGFQKFISEEHINPILNTLAVLPKDELASMAETLVNLTAFRQRISFDTETVGGPIDVAVISKGDGFVWIKRKHYFPGELNHQFLANYNRT